MASGAVRSNILDPAAKAFYPSAATPAAPTTHFDAAYFIHSQSYYQTSPYALPALYVPTGFHHPPPPPLPAAETVVADTRTVKLSMLPQHVGEAALRAEMEAFGGVRAVEVAKTAAEDGTATIHFYDLRSAQVAMSKIREQHAWQQPCVGFAVGGNWGCLRLPAELDGGIVGRGLVAGRPVWAEFASLGLSDHASQGCILVRNSDPGLSLRALRQLFESFGAVKDVKEMSSDRLVEFFDTRDAARAFSELNGRVIDGRSLVLEYTKTCGGHARPSCNYSKRSSSSHYGSKVPPRLQRSQGDEATPRSPSSSSSAAGIVVGSNREVKGAEVVLLKRSTNAYSEATLSSFSSSYNERRIKFNKSYWNYQSPLLRSKKLLQKGWKNHPKNGYGGGGGGGGGDCRFIFKEHVSSPSSCRDSRTTVMIKNIPNKYSQKLLLSMLDNHCIECNEQISEGDDHEPYSAYDFVYLPIDFHNKCNVGYGFVNLTSPEAAFRLYKAFQDQPWGVFNSRKICQVTYARLQGLEALKEHFRNSKFACDSDEYLPVVFSPPRDGKKLAEPVPVVGRESFSLSKPVIGTVHEAAKAAPLQITVDFGGASSTTTSTHAPSDNGDEDDDAAAAQEEEEEE